MAVIPNPWPAIWAAQRMNGTYDDSWCSFSTYYSSDNDDDNDNNDDFDAGDLLLLIAIILFIIIAAIPIITL